MSQRFATLGLVNRSSVHNLKKKSRNFYGVVYFISILYSFQSLLKDGGFRQIYSLHMGLGFKGIVRPNMKNLLHD